MRDLQFHLDLGGDGDSAPAFVAGYRLAEGFSLVVSSRDAGDAEIHLSEGEVALLQQRLAAMLPATGAA